MSLGCIVAAYAGVELAAAEVLDRDDVEWRRPVGTLRQWRDGEPENRGCVIAFWFRYAHDGKGFVMKDVILYNL